MVLNSIITATGRCIPEVEIPNSHFLAHTFYTKSGEVERKNTPFIIEKFVERTGISSRRYARDDQVASDLGAIALRHALDSRIDINTLDMIIAATNYGDISAPHYCCDFVPNIATRVLQKAGYDGSKGREIKAIDIPYGCPCWLEGLILADIYIQQGLAKKIAVVAAETLSRVCDPHDKDSMIYADGAGASIVEAFENETKEGILNSRSKTILYFKPATGLGSTAEPVTDCSKYLCNCPSNNLNYPNGRLFLKMLGPNVAQVARTYVPKILKEVLQDIHVSLEDVKLFLLHQANRQLDHDMARDTGIKEEELDGKVPVTIDWLGNSSVATIPTLLDLIARGELRNGNGQQYTLHPNDVIIFGSVGGSMHVNAVAYKVPKEFSFKNL